MIQRHLDLATENGKPRDETPALPGCAMRNAKGNKRSTNLDPQTSPDPHETLRLIERGKLELVYREHADDAGSDLEVADCCPKCAQRNATPTADEYAAVRTDKHAVEGRRSIDLDPVSDQTPEERIIQRENED